MIIENLNTGWAWICKELQAELTQVEEELQPFVDPVPGFAMELDLMSVTNFSCKRETNFCPDYLCFPRDSEEHLVLESWGGEAFYELWPNKVEHFEKDEKKQVVWEGGCREAAHRWNVARRENFGASSPGQLFSGNLQPAATVYTSLLLHSYLLSSVSSHIQYLNRNLCSLCTLVRTVFVDIQNLHCKKQ